MSLSEFEVEGLRGPAQIPVAHASAVHISTAIAHRAGVVWHRIRTVRQQQGVSLRRAANQLGAALSDIRQEEEPAHDLMLSRLYAWQNVLEVPAADLLVESNGALSAPIMERARMVRLMKTVAAILEKTESLSVRRLTQTLAEQLVEIMPELKDVNPWHSVGQRRSLQELGRTAERLYSDDTWSRR